MALGRGTFLVQNKVLPGSYINFVSAARASATLSDRGVAAMAVSLDWGVDEAVFTVEASQLQKDSMGIFGYDYTADALKGVRDLFKNAKTVHFYRLNGGGEKAFNSNAEALYSGVRGNDLKIAIEANEEYTEENKVYDVITYMDNVKVDSQTVGTAAELTANKYVSFKPEAVLEQTAGLPLTGGSNGVSTNASYQMFLDKIESYSFNTLGCDSDNNVIKALYASFTKRMRDDMGIKFQCVLHRYAGADYEGVILVENNDAPELVYWVTGVQAGCNVNGSVTNKVYDGEFAANTDYTESQIIAGIKAGKFMLHKVGDDVRVLSDINTFVSITDTKSSDFSSNQTVRVLDQIGNDIASVFNTKYLGKVPNDNAGRISFWNDIVKHHQQLETIRAIENFDPEAVVVEQGDTKKSVVVTDYVTPVNAMEQLYMTVVVG